jgi:hypothetical protein
MQAAFEGDGDGGRIAPGLLRVLAQIGEMLGHESGGLACRMPAIAVRGRPPQGAPRMAAHPNGDRRLLHRLGQKLDAGEAVIRAVIRRGALRPEHLEDVEPLIGHGAARRIRHAERLKLLPLNL